MSNDQAQKEQEEGLPTAAYRWRDKAGVTQASINDPEDEWCHSYGKMHGKDKLVRRNDVEALIEDKVELAEDWEYVSEVQSDETNAKEVAQEGLKRVLEELLEEVKASK